MVPRQCIHTISGGTSGFKVRKHMHGQKTCSILCDVDIWLLDPASSNIMGPWIMFRPDKLLGTPTWSQVKFSGQIRSVFMESRLGMLTSTWFDLIRFWNWKNRILNWLTSIWIQFDLKVNFKCFWMNFASIGYNSFFGMFYAGPKIRELYFGGSNNACSLGSGLFLGHPLIAILLGSGLAWDRMPPKGTAASGFNKTPGETHEEMKQHKCLPKMLAYILWRGWLRKNCPGFCLTLR